MGSGPSVLLRRPQVWYSEPSIVLVARDGACDRYGACDSAWHRWEHAVVAVC